MERKKLVITASLLLAYTIVVPVFAYMYFYRTDLTTFGAGVILESYPTPTMQLGFYWDEACTQPATTFDFGQMIHPNQETILWKRILIRNEGDTWNNIYWNSTLESVTTEIMERWNYPDNGEPNWNWGGGGCAPINSSRIESGQVVQTYYLMKIPAYATVGTYDWTLTAWGEHYY